MDASSLSRQPTGRILLGLALLALSGCVNTSLIDRWKDASFARAKIVEAQQRFTAAAAKKPKARAK